jgi:hypothetical protein
MPPLRTSREVTETIGFKYLALGDEYSVLGGSLHVGTHLAALVASEPSLLLEAGP